MERDEEIYIGIDFGTTQSIACYIDPQTGETKFITDSSNLPQYASVLAFLSQRHLPMKVLYGNAAKNQTQTLGKVVEAKRLVGQQFWNIYETLSHLPYTVVEDTETGRCLISIKDTEMNEEVLLTVEEIIAIQIAHIKQIISARIPKCKFKNVIMTVPSSFNDEQIDVLKLGYEIAGIQIAKPMREPSAAVYEYKKSTGKKLSRAIIIDIGGGTTDVCICFDQDKIRGNKGDQALGGSDFDKIMVDMILERLEEEGEEGKYISLFKIDQENDTDVVILRKRKNIMRLKEIAETCKITLSTEKIVDVDVGKLLGLEEGVDLPFGIQITRDQYEERILKSKLLDRIEGCIKESLQSVGLPPNAIESVILVGGVTYMPIVRQMIAKIFGEQKIAKNFDPLSAVAKGAARYAMSLESLEHVDQIEVLDLGVGYELNEIEWFFKKGKETPCQWKSRLFATKNDNQTHAVLDFYVGEGKYPDAEEVKNRKIISYEINNIVPRKAGTIQWQFFVDIDSCGNMTVSAIQQGINERLPPVTVESVFRKQNRPIEESRKRIMRFFPK